jgi:hypothetical protein
MKIKLKNNDEKMKNAYHEAKADIASLLGWFECELQKQPGNLNWGHVGSLTEVRHELLQTLSFISGISEDQINDSLAEARIDAETQR